MIIIKCSCWILSTRNNYLTLDLNKEICHSRVNRRTVHDYLLISIPIDCLRLLCGLFLNIEYPIKMRYPFICFLYSFCTVIDLTRYKDIELNKLIVTPNCFFFTLQVDVIEYKNPLQVRQIVFIATLQLQLTYESSMTTLFPNLSSFETYSIFSFAMIVIGIPN